MDANSVLNRDGRSDEALRDDRGLLAGVIALIGGGKLLLDVLLNYQDQPAIERDELGDQGEGVQAAKTLGAERLADGGDGEEDEGDEQAWNGRDVQ
jgi:hypothetical protein